MKNDNWNAENIPDQKGKVVIVTGSSSGIGYEAARVLANKNAEVIIAVRNLDKGNAAAERIDEQNKNADIRVMHLDLADLASIKSFTEEFKSKYSRLDRMINNAGVMIPPYSKTANGFELQFGTNHLGHFALTGQLLNVLAKTAGSRIVNVSSSAHRWGNINFDDLSWEKRRYRAWNAYGDSKIANLYFTSELDRRLKKDGLNIIVTACHPGWTATELQRHTDYFGIAGILNSLFAQDISMGALPTLRAAFDNDSKGGEFYGPGGFLGMWGYPVEAESNNLSKDAAIAERLWKVSEDSTGVRFEFDKKSLGASK
jgi:NAD(P)-dependent dehydrogenase (short-subunit alcohol dehydrogenase family)